MDTETELNIKGTLNCTRYPTICSGYEWKLTDFEPEGFEEKIRRSSLFKPIPDLSAPFYFMLRCKKTRRHLGGSHFMFTLTVSVVLIVHGIVPSNLKMIIHSSMWNREGKILEKTSTSLHTLNCGDISCIYLKRNSTNENILNFSNNEATVKCQIEIVSFNKNGSFLPSIRKSSITDYSSYLNYLEEDLKAIYEDSTLSDVTIKIGYDSLKVHKAILAARSPVLRMMLKHKCRESKEKVIKVVNYDLATVKHFVYYLYTGHLEDKNLITVLSLYDMANYYAVESLHRTCSDVIVSKLYTDDADQFYSHICQILLQANQSNDQNLLEVAKSYTAKHFWKVAPLNSWTDLLSIEPNLGTCILYAVSRNCTHLMGNNRIMH